MRIDQTSGCTTQDHSSGVTRHPLLNASRDLVRVGSRRWFLQTGLAAAGGLSLAQVLQSKATAAERPAGRDRQAVILFWLSGGPSQIDTWDPKPLAPHEIRGPYQPIDTSVPGIQVCEHLPLQASVMHKLTVIRSVDCSASNHTPITMQAGNPLARRTDDGRDGGGYPSMGSVCAKFRGSNDPEMPGFVGLAPAWEADVWGAGQMGNEFQPVKGLELPGKLTLPAGIQVDRLQDRNELRRQFDRLERGLDLGRAMDGVDRFQQMACDMVLSGRVQQAFDVSQETDETRDAYGRNSVGEKALLARRLVESGVTYVLVSGAWGYFDHHGDNVPPWGGILKGLTPILPTIDRAMYALVNDLDDRGLLDSTMIMMMGEFGRSPVMTQDRGRNHWTNVMSMLMAGGSLPSGRVVGATDRNGGEIVSQAVTPSDLAATTFKHLDIDREAHWLNPQGRPVPIVTQGGQPLS